MAQNMDTKVITGEVRLSYVHLLTPYSGRPDIEAKYSCVLIIDKSDTKTINAIKAAQKAALEEAISSRWGGKRPKGLRSTLHDGDDDEQTDVEKNPEYEGCYYLTVSSKNRPGIVDRQLQPLDSSDRVVFRRLCPRVNPGHSRTMCSGNKGISFGLNNVQILRDGDPFGGVSRPEDDFDSLDALDMDDEDDDLI